MLDERVDYFLAQSADRKRSFNFASAFEQQLPVNIADPLGLAATQIVVTGHCDFWCRVRRLLKSLDSGGKSGNGGFSGGGGDFSGGGAGIDGNGWGDTGDGGGPQSNCGCFVAGTQILTPTGHRQIQQIKVGDVVLAFDERTGKTAAKQVLSLIRPDLKPLYRIATQDDLGAAETFEVTADHRWKLIGKGWVQTIQLHAGDRIETASHESAL